MLKQNIFWSTLRLFGHQNWIRFGIRDKVLRCLCDPTTIDSHDFEIDFFGSRYIGNLSSFIDWTVYFYGVYEGGLLYLLRNLAECLNRPLFIDVGANVGQHSLFMAKHCWKVHAFEPYDYVREQLELKIERNEIKNVIVHSVALGECDAMLNYYAPQGSNLGTGSFVPSRMDSKKGVGKLMVSQGDKQLADLNMGDENLIIKIDVEGFEKMVLAGSQDTINTYRPTLVMEFSEQTKASFANYNDLMSYLPHDYQIKRIVYDSPYFLIFNKPNYNLVDFDFCIPGGELLLAPLKMYTLLSGL